MDQMKAIETMLVDVATEQASLSSQSMMASDTNRQQDVETALRRQGDLLHSLTDGLEQFEDRLANRLIEVIRAATASMVQSTSGVHAVPQGFSSETSEASEVAEDSRPAMSDGAVDQSWNAIREAMMASAAEEVVESAPEREEITTEADESADAAPSAAESESGGTIEPVHFDIPEPIDIASVHDEQLQDAILAREDIMRVMATRLRQRIELAAPISTDQLRELADELPDEFRDHVRNTLALLDGQLRLTELELSLERARLGRQMSQLAESQAAIRSTARQLGCTVLEDGTLEGSVPTTESSRDRRWMRVLGFGR